MSHTVYFGNVSKRKNSTLQPSLTTSFDVLFKTPTSLDRPTFTLSADSFDYNYAIMGDRYYFVSDIVSRNNGIWEVSCELDPLATFKSDILASTQYVCYSSVQGGTWLADTRIPVLKSTTATKSTSAVSVLSTIGCYILSVVGKDSAATYMFYTDSNIKAIISEISTWEDDGIQSILSDIDTTDTDTLLESLSKVITNTGFIGNAYSQAPSCIRSCIYVPFDYALAPTNGSDTVYLGNFDTGVTGYRLTSTPATGSTTVSIPWHFSDWRRGYCEDVYLYLPLVGMVGLSSDSLTNVSSITVKWSATYTDGCIAYEVVAGNEIIGTYGGNCSVNYPIGINQQASAGEIANSFISGLQKTISAGINSSISPVSTAMSGVGMIAEGVIGAYNVQNVASSTHASCVGGIGGGAGAGLDLTIACYTVAHNTIVEPSEMVDTMGYPTMKPLALSSCTGYCQCANAHVSATAESQYLNAIDSYLNSGFYIE